MGAKTLNLMSNINYLFYSIVFISLSFVTCKSDQKDASIGQDKNASSMKVSVYDAETRKIDSLKMVEKMTTVYGEQIELMSIS